MDGGAGTDSLEVEIDLTTTVSPTISNMESLTATFTNSGIISLANEDGSLETITNSGSSEDAVFSNIQSVDSLNLVISDIDDDTLSTTYSFLSSAVSGTSDSVTLTLSNVDMSDAGGVGTPTITLPGIETINLVSTG